MEQIAGKVLLRRSNPVTPTDAGQSVLRIARQSEFLQQEMERELMGVGGFQSVSVAVNADSLATWFIDAVGTLSREDSIFCDLRREGEFHSSAMLRSGEVMAVITSKPEKIPGCSVETLGVARYWCVATPDFVQRYLPGWPKTMSREELNRAPIQSPTIYIPSSPDYARAVSSGIAWGLIPEAQCAEELESGHLVKLAAIPVEFPLYWQRWNINSPVRETVTRRVHEAARGDLIY